MCINHLQMNDTRTELITFGTPHLLSKKNLDSLTIGGTTVSCSKTIKFLCVFVDETLSFKQDVAACASLALYRIHLMKNVKKYLTMATRKMLMCTLVLSQLDCIKCILTSTCLTTSIPYEKNPEPSCMNHLQKGQKDQCSILHERASLVTSQIQVLLETSHNFV